MTPWAPRGRGLPQEGLEPLADHVPSPGNDGPGDVLREARHLTVIQEELNSRLELGPRGGPRCGR
eukprot:187204-Lingulodinium_polyedra.AAC.1